MVPSSLMTSSDEGIILIVLRFNVVLNFFLSLEKRKFVQSLSDIPDEATTEQLQI